MQHTHPTPARVLAICVGVLAICVGVLAADASAVAHATATGQPAVPVVRAQGPTTGPSTDPSADSTLPPGPRIEPEESEQATQDRAQQKAIMAAAAIGLLVIVVFGRKQRNKHRPGKK